MLLAAWKLALPAAVFLLRGNHESATCTLMYGFKGELVAKYGKSHWRVRGWQRVCLCAAVSGVVLWHASCCCCCWPGKQGVDALLVTTAWQQAGNAAVV